MTLADGLKSRASIVSAGRERDLAVLQAKTIPDDLVPATIGSSRRLNVGDRVVSSLNQPGSREIYSE